MVLEYDWKSNAYCSRFDDPFPMIEQSFETLAAARLALGNVGLRLGAKIDPRTWRIEFLEPADARAEAFRLGKLGHRENERLKRSYPLACRQNGRSNGGTAALEAQSRTPGGQAIVKHAGRLDPVVQTAIWSGVSLDFQIGLVRLQRLIQLSLCFCRPRKVSPLRSASFLSRHFPALPDGIIGI